MPADASNQPASPSSVLSKMRSSFAQQPSQVLTQDDQAPTATSEPIDQSPQASSVSPLQPQLQLQSQPQSFPATDQPTDQPGKEPVFDQAISLAVADQILTDIEQQRNQQIQGQVASTGGREQEPNAALDAAQVEAGAALQYVEQEPAPELPPEVEGYLEHVEDHTYAAPQEIVLADHQEQPLPSHVPKQSVVVLPIDPEVEKQGARKNPKFSVRWLVEWSRKLMKMFAGKVIYREVE